MAKKNTPVPMPAQRQPQKPSKPTQNGGHTSTNGASNWILPALLLLAITALCYLPSLSNEYVNWDDDSNISDNTNLAYLNWENFKNIFTLDKGNVIGNYNPLSIATFFAEKWWAGGVFDPHLTHTVNLLLHLGVVFFAFRLLVLMGLKPWAAFVGGLLFGIHPMRVESVAWATERKDVLFGIFFFAALVVYARWIKTESSGKKMAMYLLMIVLAACSSLSKVQAVTLPLAMLCLDYWFQRPLVFQRVWEKAPFWIFSLMIGVANIYTLRQAGSTDDTLTNYSIFDRLLIGTYSFCTYLYKLPVPYPMSPMYPYEKVLPTLAYVSPLGFIAVFYGLWWLWKKGTGREWIFGVLFFFFNVMFVLQVFGAGQGYLADRFTYVPYFGFFFIAAYWYQKLTDDAKYATAANAIAGIALVFFAFMTYKQIGIWQNGETLWTHVLGREGRTISLPNGNRANYYRAQAERAIKEKNGPKAKELYEKSLKDYTEAISISPNKMDQYNSRGKTYFDMSMSSLFRERQKELAKNAISDYDKGLSDTNLKPKARGEMLANRGAAYASIGNIDQSIADLTESIPFAPDNKNTYLNRSLSYFTKRQYDLAIQDHTKYLELAPYDGPIHYERGMCKRLVNDLQGAMLDLNKSVQLNPKEPMAYLERARVHALLNEIDMARQDGQKAINMGVNIAPEEMRKLGL